RERYLFSSRLQLLALLLEHRFTAELDLVAFERQDLDQNLIAFLQLVADVVDAGLRDLADVQQTVRAREDLDKRAEIHQPNHLAQIRLADLGRRGEILDDLYRAVGAGFVRRRNVDRAIVLDIDFDAGLLDDPAD